MSNIVSDLNQLLADYQIHYQRVRNFHWNVTGPHFFTLHDKFEELYLAAAEVVDNLAERILALHGQPISTLKATLDLTNLEESGTDLDAMAMVAKLVQDFTYLNGELTKLAEKADDAGDSTTVAWAEDLKNTQEKTRWMLRAFAA